MRTRKTRGKQPLELASAEEQAARRVEEQTLREFFAGMERNILRRIEDGGVLGCPDDAVRPNGPAAAGDAGGIDRSWMDAAAIPSHGDRARDDWISGWITPDSSASTADARGDSTSLSSMEGLSPGPGGLASPGYSLGSLSRKEADDGFGALLGIAATRERSQGARPGVDRIDLIPTISRMEDPMVHQLNPTLQPMSPALCAPAHNLLPSL